VLSPVYVLIDADKFQLAHWILREAGYSCNVADIMGRAGVSYGKAEAMLKFVRLLRKHHKNLIEVLKKEGIKFPYPHVKRVVKGIYPDYEWKGPEVDQFIRELLSRPDLLPLFMNIDSEFDSKIALVMKGKMVENEAV
jgi:hypothetical protein